MKANELNGKNLMVGDWVVYEGDTNYDNPIRIEGMDIATKSLITSDREDVGFDGIEPIPLTDEILEKNEWRCFNTYHRYSHPKAPFEIRQQKDGGYTIEVDADEYGSAVFLFILYVHELQQVLRLCGIDKEIVL